MNMPQDVTQEILVRCQEIRTGALLPMKATVGSSGFDLHACLDEPLLLEPGRWAAVPTGLIMAIPDGYEGTVRARSGLALRHGLGLLNGPGTIDSDYRGEVAVLLMNWGPDPVRIKPGDRIAQIIFQTVVPVQVQWAQELSNTERGSRGFGHSGTAPLGEKEV